MLPTQAAERMPSGSVGLSDRRSLPYRALKAYMHSDRETTESTKKKEILTLIIQCSVQKPARSARDIYLAYSFSFLFFFNQAHETKVMAAINTRAHPVDSQLCAYTYQ